MSYCAYFLDSDNHITDTGVIEAGSLHAAIQAAMVLLHGLPSDHTVELWQAENRLCSLPPSTYVSRARRVGCL
jgi:hypothetical protein